MILGLPAIYAVANVYITKRDKRCYLQSRLKCALEEKKYKWFESVLCNSVKCSLTPLNVTASER